MSEQITNWVTLGSCIIIIAFFVYFLFKTKAADDKYLLEHKREIDAYPSIISTLGVIGTFLGITIGLINFNVNNLNQSIPILLGGLKTAFFTSLCGMVGSLILRHYWTDKKFDKEENGISSTEEAVKELGKSVKEMNTTLLAFTDIKDIAKQSSNTQASFYTQFLDLCQNNSEKLRNVDSTLSHLSIVQGEQTTSLRNVTTTLNEIGSVNRRMEEVLGEIAEAERGNVGTFDDMNEELRKFSQILRSEVDEIEEKMGETNKLLTDKFNEFSDLLKKSNTEALVEVMKKVTEEFQNQMNALISKLVQENFAKLNDSVEKLNSWQVENKVMVDSLVNQYHQMEEDFTNSSTVMQEVSAHVQMLVGNSGKLAQLITTLEEAMVNDKKFIEISNNLSTSAFLAKGNMEKQETIAAELRDWVDNVQVFKDDVQRLINKLEELNSIRNYNEQFWQSTKRSLEEGVGILQSGSNELNNQIRDIDQSFYNRLSATLSNLDNLIASMANRYLR